MNVCELTKKYHIEWIVFMPSDGCVYPGNNAVPIFINVLTETSRFDRKFYFSEKFLDIKLESIEREVEKKTRLSPDSNIGEKEKDKDNRISKRLTDRGEFSNRN